MAKALVIVESPAKVKTINKILGSKFKVTSSMGHVIDLPKSTLGVDIEQDFSPKFIVMRDKMKVLSRLKKEASSMDEIYFASDPDREGEAIAWNLVPYLIKPDKKSKQKEDKKFYRVVFHEITKEAVKKAFEHKRDFDIKKVNAQNARRVLDRIVGYLISPILWKKVGGRLSAGRVQSVALRMIVERERAILSFIPSEYWQMSVLLEKEGVTPALEAQLEKINQDKIDLKNEQQAREIAEELQTKLFRVTNVIVRDIKRNALPPFITSTLQQDAFGKLGFNAQRTMMIAQQLYEGIEIGNDEAVGLITYMRTDSVNIAQEAIGHVREYVTKEYGVEFLPETPNYFKSKKQAQEAHEAIRPTDVFRKPEEIKAYLTTDQFELYQLIWRRFVSCQMAPAVFQSKKVEIMAGDRYQFGASGSTLVFQGCLAVYRQGEEEEKKQDLSAYQKEDLLKMLEAKPTQHFTKPPARFSEASLVKALEEEGIGRPSTYAAIIQTLVTRNYVLRDRGYFTATELGLLVCDILIANFSKIMDIGFTAEMEENLDKIEEGGLEYVQLLKEFYAPLKEALDSAVINVEKTNIEFDKKCPVCDKPLLVKWGRTGRFLSCSGFPECKHAESYPTGVLCPEQGCSGELIERRNYRGGIFYGCSRYPECKHISNKLPQTER